MKLLLVQCIQLIEKSIVNLLAVQILIPLNLLRHDETYLFLKALDIREMLFVLLLGLRGDCVRIQTFIDVCLDLVQQLESSLQSEV